MDITGFFLVAIVAAIAAAYKYSSSFREWVDFFDQLEYKEEEDKA